jgi:hypothetical protein
MDLDLIFEFPPNDYLDYDGKVRGEVKIGNMSEQQEGRPQLQINWVCAEEMPMEEVYV